MKPGKHGFYPLAVALLFASTAALAQTAEQYASAVARADADRLELRRIESVNARPSERATAMRLYELELQRQNPNVRFSAPAAAPAPAAQPQSRPVFITCNSQYGYTFCSGRS